MPASKSKVEVEISVDPGERTRLLLHQIGFVSTLKYEKHCRIYRGEIEGRKIEAAVVEVPELPSTYLELEIQAQNEPDALVALTALRNLRDLIGLRDTDETSEYYTSLVRQARSLGTIEKS